MRSYSKRSFTTHILVESTAKHARPHDCDLRIVFTSGISALVTGTITISIYLITNSKSGESVSVGLITDLTKDLFRGIYAGCIPGGVVA